MGLGHLFKHDVDTRMYCTFQNLPCTGFLLSISSHIFGIALLFVKLYFRPFNIKNLKNILCNCMGISKS